MSSTSLHNDKVQYCREQRNYNLANEFLFDKNRSVSNNNAFPHRLLVGRMVNGYNNNILSQNTADIESALLGIGSTNLVKSKEPVVAKINNLPSRKFFDGMQTFIPEPLVVPKFQRPIGPFC